MWKAIFIAFTVIGLYFGYGVAQTGGPGAFFSGAAIGAIVCYLWMRTRAEAAANVNTNTQNMTVQFNENKTRIDGTGFSEQQIMAIAEIVDSTMRHNQLVVHNEIPEPELPPSQSERLAELLRRRRHSNV